MIPVPIELLEWLRALPDPKDTGRVISSSMGRHKKADDEFRYGMATKAISTAWKALSLPNLTPHRLRASFATIHATEMGTHISVIQQLLRHKHITTTQKYICVHDTVKQEAQKGWSREQRPIEKPGNAAGNGL
jgi:integrase